jgi:hypothetical protein
MVLTRSAVQVRLPVFHSPGEAGMKKPCAVPSHLEFQHASKFVNNQHLDQLQIVDFLKHHVKVTNKETQDMLQQHLTE